MTRLQRIILALLPPGWRAEAEADSRAWHATCAACGTTTSIWDLGGLRWKGNGNRASGMRCKACGKFGRPTSAACRDERTDGVIDYQGKVALITGGASGIGKALAEALAARGAHVIIADIKADAAAAVAEELNGLALPVDLADDAAAAALITKACDWKGQLDLVCANAGFGRNKRLLKEPFDEAAMHLFAVNLFAPLRLAQAYAATLTARGARGRLMITGSENSLSLPGAVRRNGLGAYGATKHGVLIMAEWLHEELRGETMDVHILLPGGVYTPLISKHIPDPEKLPPEMNIITAERCADLALKGMDLGLFYIPTHAHIADDMRPRTEGVLAALAALGLT